ncbi:MAG TPA: LysM peptidoglycan-binding domain-containing protein [Myxococcales bacterium]
MFPSGLLILTIAALCLTAPAARAQEPEASAPAGVAEPQQKVDEQHDETADDPDTQEEVDKSAAEMEAVRKAEEKAGLVPQAPGAGAHDALTVGMDESDPLARDIALALGEGLDGAPLADPTPGGAASVSLPELLGISEQELRAKYDIPVELNDAVVAYIRFFQTDAREHFARWLARSTRYLPMMRATLDKEGVPLDLVYLSMIESGFNAYAYSFAKAAGLWQFMVGTSRRYGLVTDFWIDERRDPAKATLAAAKYLRDLRQRFHGDWYLAWAGYNAGEGKVDKAIKRDKTKDFWMMMGKGRTLRAETKHYVPKLIAAALIAKHPERFGFQVDYETPEPTDEVRVPDSTDLHVIAKAAGVPFEKVRDLNPELRRFCTPPGGFTLKLPQGTKDTFLAAYEKLDPKDRLSFVEHKVEKGEPLNKIARAYGVSESAILRTNGIRSLRQIKVGRTLVIPMGGASRHLAAGFALEDKHKARPQGRAAVAAVSKGERRTAVPATARGYVVRPGDSLWTIASKFATTVDKLKRLNGMTGRGAKLLVGQTLAVHES